MCRQNAVLIRRPRPAHQFQRAQIGGEKAQSRHPRGHFPARHEKIFSGIRPATQIEADSQHQREVKYDDGEIHAGPGFPTTVGDGCVIGHLAHLEGCVLEDDSLVGSGSVVLHRAVIGYGATVGANAVVTNDMRVPAEALAVGVPAVIKENRSSLVFNQGAAALYVANGKRYKATLVRLDP